MTMYNKLTRKATRLVEKLQQDIDNGKQIYENYGQKEIRKFMEKEISPLAYGVLTYSEKCDIENILNKVSSIC